MSLSLISQLNLKVQKKQKTHRPWLLIEFIYDLIFGIFQCCFFIFILKNNQFKIELSNWVITRAGNGGDALISQMERVCLGNHYLMIHSRSLFSFFKNRTSTLGYQCWSILFLQRKNIDYFTVVQILSNFSLFLSQ